MCIFGNQLKRVTILISQSHISQVSTPGASELVTDKGRQCNGRTWVRWIWTSDKLGKFSHKKAHNNNNYKNSETIDIWDIFDKSLGRGTAIFISGDGYGVIKVRYLIEVLATQRFGCLKIFKIIECILDIKEKKEYWYGMLMEVKSRIFDGSSQFKSHN